MTYEEDIRAKRLVLALMYAGPWVRIADWLWKLDPEQEDDGPEVGRIRDWLARRALKMDYRWRRRHIRRRIMPHDRWRVK